ncbi:tetratricopeptide repeat protein [Chryseosolibacter indicus]|uniref:Tetratricopeptide repeat protein n=1 Tax=Chryseosolibacter indicus TaxID=2782351 RepID=A0ABS5VQD1_9BACT|nr:tetratricopeptide repeat protein [Chryseosolibacter indicus]MBT1703346.1 tetratricopeptide repeat protein [Chryseosolibacter indicus]
MELEKALYKADYLLKQKRYAEAHKEVNTYLASDPESIPALIILIQIYLGLDKNEKADEVADQLIKLDPSDANILYLKGLTQTQTGKRKSALKFLDSALAFDPMMAEAHGLKAAIYFLDAEFEKALEAADNGLRIDPQNEICLNHRSMALLRLDRKEDHVQADQQALKSNPMNPLTHASVGFGALQKGEYDKAKDHFREALRIDPTNEYARQGMLESIRATNLYYRLFLKYAFWMQGLTPQVRWAVIILGYVMIRGLDSVSNALGTFAPIAQAVVIVYTTFAISTWIIGPVSNIFLRFHAFGKYVLTEEEIDVANRCAALLLMAVLGAVLFYSFDVDPDVQWKNLGFYVLCSGIALTVVVSSIATRTLEKSKRRLKTLGTIFGIGCGVLILMAFVLPNLAWDIFNLLLYSFIGYQFYANSQE